SPGSPQAGGTGQGTPHAKQADLRRGRLPDHATPEHGHPAVHAGDRGGHPPGRGARKTGLRKIALTSSTVVCYKALALHDEVLDADGIYPPTATGEGAAFLGRTVTASRRHPAVEAECGGLLF